MGIRETLNEKPQITTGIAAGIIGVAFLLILWQMFGGSGGGGGGSLVTELWFTTDDGKTRFAASADSLAPFQKDGKEAVKINVFTCDSGKTTFVTYLERYTPDAKKKLEEIRARQKANAGSDTGGPPSDVGEMEMIFSSGLEIKKANDPTAKWISVMNPAANALRSGLKCPDGTSNENLRPWLPMDE